LSVQLVVLFDVPFLHLTTFLHELQVESDLVLKQIWLI